MQFPVVACVTAERDHRGEGACAGAFCRVHPAAVAPRITVRPCRRYKNGAPASFWLPGFFFTPSFTTAALQNYVRARNMPIDSVQFDFEMLPGSAAAGVEAPSEGVVVYGMYLEGCAWDAAAQELTESAPKVLTAEAPAVWLKPVTVDVVSEYPHYSCPVYRTAERKGTLAAPAKPRLRVRGCLS